MWFWKLFVHPEVTLCRLLDLEWWRLIVCLTVWTEHQPVCGRGIHVPANQLLPPWSHSGQGRWEHLPQRWPPLPQGNVSCWMSTPATCTHTCMHSHVCTHTHTLSLMLLKEMWVIWRQHFSSHTHFLKKPWIWLGYNALFLVCVLVIKQPVSPRTWWGFLCTAVFLHIFKSWHSLPQFKWRKYSMSWVPNNPRL